MTWKGKGRELRQYTSGMWPQVSEDLAQKMLEVGGGSVWKFRPPSSPEWPSGLWSYVVGAPDLSEEEIEEWIAEKYIGDWAPDKVKWTIQRLDRDANHTMTVVANRSRSNQGENMKRLEKFTSKELESMPTLATGQADDLKHDDGKHRWWLDRVGPESGATHKVAVEELTLGRWKVVHQYEPYRSFNKAKTAERLKRI